MYSDYPFLVNETGFSNPELTRESRAYSDLSVPSFDSMSIKVSQNSLEVSQEFELLPAPEKMIVYPSIEVVTLILHWPVQSQKRLAAL